MEFNKLKQTVRNIRKGVNAVMVWKSEPNVLAKAKAAGNYVEKITKGKVRFGIKYSNMKGVEQKDYSQDGEIENTNWAEWIPGEENYLLQHKKDNSRTYLRPALSSDHWRGISKIKTTYLLNGQKVSTDYLIEHGICSMSEIENGKKKDELRVFNVKTENVLLIKTKKGVVK